MDGWVKSKHRVKTLLVKHTNLANEKKGSGLLLLSAWSTNQVEQRSAFLSRLMPNLLNRCQLWLKCWSELWNQAEAGLLAIPSLVLLLPSRNSNDRRLLELLLLLLSSRRPPDFFTRLEQLISGRSSLEHYGFNCLSPPTTTTSTRLLVCLIDTSSSNQSVFLVATGTGRLWRTHATSTRLWTLMAPASWPDDDDRHVSNFMTIK